MALVKVRDEVELMAYLESLVVDDLERVVYVDAGDDIDKRVREFLSNERLTGLVMFVWLGEGVSTIKAGAAGYEMTGLMCMLGQVADKKAAMVLGMRKKTRECLLNVLGRIDADEEECRMRDFEDRWEFRREDDRFLPSSEIGNTASYGWTVGFEVWVESGKVVYKDVNQYLG